MRLGLLAVLFVDIHVEVFDFTVDDVIMELYFTVNIYSGCSTFRHVYNSYVRICLADPEKTNKSFAVSTVYARYPLDQKIKTRALVFAKLTRV